MLNMYGQLPTHRVDSAANGNLSLGTDVAASIRHNFRVNFTRMLDELKAKGVSHKAFAKLVHVKAPVISQLKSGKFFPGPELLQAIAEAGGISADELIKDPNKPKVSVQEIARHLLEQAGFRVIKPS